MSTQVPHLWPMMRRVERAAATTLSQCQRLLGLVDLPLPVPVESWVESPLGLRFGVTDLSHLGKDVLGLARPKEREIIVSETLADQESRFRFTIAHELGHIVLHSKIQSEFRELDEGVFLNKRVEREADRFAASLLMPVSPLAALFSESCVRLEIDPRALLYAMQSGEEPALRLFRSRIVPVISRRFCVSLSAAAYRFADFLLDNGMPVLAPRQVKPLLPTVRASKESRPGV